MPMGFTIMAYRQRDSGIGSADKDAPTGAFG
jgi:hypothetical protein